MAQMRLASDGLAQSGFEQFQKRRAGDMALTFIFGFGQALKEPALANGIQDRERLAYGAHRRAQTHRRICLNRVRCVTHRWPAGRSGGKPVFRWDLHPHREIVPHGIWWTAPEMQSRADERSRYSLDADGDLVIATQCLAPIWGLGCSRIAQGVFHQRDHPGVDESTGP